MAVAHHQTRKRTCSFSSPPASKAPRLASSKSISSLSAIHDRAMACATHPSYSSQPYEELMRNQYIWPDTAVERGRITFHPNPSAAHNANLRKQFEYSHVFRKQFSGFVAQLAYEQALERTIRPPYTRPGPSVDFSLGTSVTPFPTGPISQIFSSHAALLRQPSIPPPKPRRRHSARMLIPPRPRVSSPLSPRPPQTPLAGPARRPMPLRKGRDASLLKQAVCNTERGRQIAALGPHAAVKALEAQTNDKTEDVMMDYPDERLGQSWVVVPCEDWEMVDTGEIAIIP